MYGISAVDLVINCSSPTISYGLLVECGLLVLAEIFRLGPVFFNTSDITNNGGLLSVACPIPGTNNFGEWTL
jgi:hypothetical protein